MTLLRFRFIALGLALFAGPAASLAAEEHNPVSREPLRASSEVRLGVIVKLRKTGAGASLLKLGAVEDRVSALAKRTGVALTLRREISDSMMAHTVDLRGTTAAQVLDRLSADEAVEYVSPDFRRYPHATQPNDPLFAGQWYLMNTEVSAVNAIDAWDTERGLPGVVVAVLDTGVLFDHPDLGRADQGGRLLPGHDFVSADHMVNDGNGRDSDPSDPGDWVNDADKSNALFAECDVVSSSWHGTRVAGVLGASTNNSAGVAGLTWNSYLLPVRVLGKCGGVDSDILAGLRWAGGLNVPGVPVNPTPARILNASFGNSTACQASYREVIEELAARKVVLVISAGNEGTMVSSPANCPGVAAVASIRHAGSKVGFSNLGPEVTIAAPGGNCVNINGGPCLFSLDTTSNDGATSPGNHLYTDQFRSNLGTSFSAPIVSGVAALMLSRNANLSTEQLLARLREGARLFPTSVPGEPNLTACRVPLSNQDFQLTQCLCTTTTCGAGMLSAANAVTAADRPIAAVSLPAAVSPGQNLSLDARGSAAACGRSVSEYSWALVAPGPNPPVIAGADSAIATLTAPTSGALTIRLTVTDNLGRSDTADILVEPTQVLSSAPGEAGTTPCAPLLNSGAPPGSSGGGGSSSSSGGSGSNGGGGSVDVFTLLGLLCLGFISGTRRHRLSIRRCI